MTTKTSHCARCGRTLTDPKSVAAGVGPKCAKRIAKTAVVVMAQRPAAQVDKALELIADGAVVLDRRGVFTVISSDGAQRYATTPTQCTCKAGTFGRVCYHRVAVELIAA